MDFANLWLDRLAICQSLTFLATDNGKHIHATGVVQTKQSDSQLDMFETIYLGKTPSYDVKRFSIQDDLLYFYRKRMGAFELIATFAFDEYRLVPLSSHWCYPDCYSSVLKKQQNRIILDILVQGKNKHQNLVWVYC